MYWTPDSMTKNAVATRATAAPAVSSASKILIIGATSIGWDLHGAEAPEKDLPFLRQSGPVSPPAVSKAFPGARRLKFGVPLPGTDALETLWKRFGNAASRVAQRGRRPG